MEGDWNVVQYGDNYFFAGTTVWSSDGPGQEPANRGIRNARRQFEWAQDRFEDALNDERWAQAGLRDRLSEAKEAWEQVPPHLHTDAKNLPIIEERLSEVEKRLAASERELAWTMGEPHMSRTNVGESQDQREIYEAAHRFTQAEAAIIAEKGVEGLTPEVRERKAAAVANYKKLSGRIKEERKSVAEVSSKRDELINTIGPDNIYNVNKANAADHYVENARTTLANAEKQVGLAKDSVTEQLKNYEKATVRGANKVDAEPTFDPGNSEEMSTARVRTSPGAGSRPESPTPSSSPNTAKPSTTRGRTDQTPGRSSQSAQGPVKTRKGPATRSK